jgi:hypothetical protein
MFLKEEWRYRNLYGSPVSLEGNHHVDISVTIMRYVALSIFALLVSFFCAWNV